MGNVIDVKSVEQFEEIRAKAQGPLAVEFVMDGCEPCAEQKPQTEAVAAARPDLTVLRVEVNAVPELADKFKVSGTPTLLHACQAKNLTPSRAQEAASPAELNKARCPVPKRKK